MKARTDDDIDLLHHTIANALLHLYLTMSETGRYTPLLRRNEILVKFLKPKSKSHAYKKLWKDFKVLIRQGQSNEDLEAALHRLYSMTVTLDNLPPDSHQNKMYALYDYMEKHSAWNTELFLRGHKTHLETVYFIRDHLLTCFDDQGNQIAPLSVMAQTARAEELLIALATNSPFVQEVAEWNREEQSIHIKLHPPGYQLEKIA